MTERISQTSHLQACARTLAHEASAEVDLTALSASSSLLARAEDSKVPDVEIQAALRGSFDAVALKHAHHDSQVQRRFEPVSPVSRALFSIVERERYEALGAREFTGVAANLAAWRRSSTPDLAAMDAGEVYQQAMLEQFTASLCREAFCGRQPTNDAQWLSADERRRGRALAAPWLEQLNVSLGDQVRFARLASEMVEQLSQIMTWQSDPHVDNPATDKAADEDVDSESDGAPADIQELGEAGESVDDESTDPAEEIVLEDDELSAPPEAPSEHALDEPPSAGADPSIVVTGDSRRYHPYTTEFDEVISAAEWANKAELIQWREELDQHIAVHGRLVRRLSARLQRVLLARQKRHWQFDLEEGILDTARLSRIVSDPLMPLSFKAESDIAFRNTTITLLIDNSRSMLGRPIMIAAACADILAQTLERCGVAVEILGFTTAHLHGGSSTERWEQQGKPDNPGRLNDLRHIVYKPADMPYRTARRNLALMLDKNLLKQNIDGEALLWAYQRLLKRPQERRILMTISDGAPIDTSTLGANAGDYLARHLQWVIDTIERSANVELMAIGIGHDVSRFYSHAVTVFDARQLGSVMLNELEMLFRQAA